MEGSYRGSLLNFFVELSGKQSLPRTMQRWCICVEEPHIQDCVFSGKVLYLMKTKTGLHPGIFLAWIHQFKSQSWQPRV